MTAVRTRPAVRKGIGPRGRCGAPLPRRRARDDEVEGGGAAHAGVRPAVGLLQGLEEDGESVVAHADAAKHDDGHAHDDVPARSSSARAESARRGAGGGEGWADPSLWRAAARTAGDDLVEVIDDHALAAAGAVVRGHGGDGVVVDDDIDHGRAGAGEGFLDGGAQTLGLGDALAVAADGAGDGGEVDIAELGKARRPCYRSGSRGCACRRRGRGC